MRILLGQHTLHGIFGWEVLPGFLAQDEQMSLHLSWEEAHGRDLGGVLGVFQVPVDREGDEDQQCSIPLPCLPKLRGNSRHDKGLDGDCSVPPAPPPPLPPRKKRRQEKQ